MPNTSGLMATLRAHVTLPPLPPPPAPPTAEQLARARYSYGQTHHGYVVCWQEDYTGRCGRSWHLTHESAYRAAGQHRRYGSAYLARYYQ